MPYACALCENFPLELAIQKTYAPFHRLKLNKGEFLVLKDKFDPFAKYADNEARLCPHHYLRGIACGFFSSTNPSSNGKIRRQFTEDPDWKALIDVAKNFYASFGNDDENKIEALNAIFGLKPSYSLFRSTKKARSTQSKKIRGSLQLSDESGKGFEHEIFFPMEKKAGCGFDRFLLETQRDLIYRLNGNKNSKDKGSKRHAPFDDEAAHQSAKKAKRTSFYDLSSEGYSELSESRFREEELVVCSTSKIQTRSLSLMSKKRESSSSGASSMFDEQFVDTSSKRTTTAQPPKSPQVVFYENPAQETTPIRLPTQPAAAPVTIEKSRMQESNREFNDATVHNDLNDIHEQNQVMIHVNLNGDVSDYLSQTSVENEPLRISATEEMLQSKRVIKEEKLETNQVVGPLNDSDDRGPLNATLVKETRTVATQYESVAPAFSVRVTQQDMDIYYNNAQHLHVTTSDGQHWWMHKMRVPRDYKSEMFDFLGLNVEPDNNLVLPKLADSLLASFFETLESYSRPNSLNKTLPESK